MSLLECQRNDVYRAVLSKTIVLDRLNIENKQKLLAQSVGTVEYTNCFSPEG